MRTVGAILSLLCALVSIGLLFMGHIVVFEENQLIPQSESPLPEGNDYWIRLEFWHDIRSYALWLLAAFGGVIIPTFGVIRSLLPITTRKSPDWILSGISGFYLILWSWGLAMALSRPELDRIMIPPLIMFAGCLYGLLVFWQRSRYRIEEEAQQGAPSNGGQRSSLNSSFYFRRG